MQPEIVPVQLCSAHAVSKKVFILPSYEMPSHAFNSHIE